MIMAVSSWQRIGLLQGRSALEANRQAYLIRDDVLDWDGQENLAFLV
jgi:hypothetical protein